MTAATQIHFGNPGNRFRPALVGGRAPRAARRRRARDDRGGPGDAGVPRASASPTWCPFATARADELTPRPAAGRAAPGSRRFVDRHRPRVVAMLGITAYRIAFERPDGDDRAAARAARPAPSSGWCRTRAGSTPTRRSPPSPRRTPSPRAPRASCAVGGTLTGCGAMSEHRARHLRGHDHPAGVRRLASAGSTIAKTWSGDLAGHRPRADALRRRPRRRAARATSRSRSSTARSTDAPGRFAFQQLGRHARRRPGAALRRGAGVRHRRRWPASAARSPSPSTTDGTHTYDLP